MSCWAVTVYLEPVRNVAVNCTKCCLFSLFIIIYFLTKTIWEYIRNTHMIPFFGTIMELFIFCFC